MNPLLQRKWLYWLLAALAVAWVAWFALRAPAQIASIGAVTKGALEQVIAEDGKTRLKTRYVLAAPVAGLVHRIELKPGDAVKAGQVVAEIEPASSGLLDPRSRAQAQAEVSAADAAVRAARARVSAASTAAALAQSELRRAEELRRSGFVTDANVEATRARAAAASSEQQSARADEGSAAQRLQMARATLSQEGQEGRVGRGRVVAVRAPVDAVVLKRPFESATPVAVGQTLLEVGDPAALEIEAEVLSADAVRLRPGLPARLSRWGGDGVLDAKVTRVEPGAFTKVSALGVEEQRTRVILDLVTPRERWAALGDGFRVEIEFLLQRDENVLQVPATALFRAGDGWAAYRLDGGRARRVVVKTGIRTALAAQVLEGLSDGDAVVLQPDDRIVDGTRINPAVRR
ncbi:MAG TPA: HlyD family efflux transporter periplasmic adaptor subunit [Casimicrobium huifangae]|jgi:HlyD family secretion protein|uniref:efflux RND transporter periplasmic adaptor subunit n=1 Tax=Casimicrobium huifangae TaxID=2591109 RepID=UPI002BD4B29B|nr:HlyD family efflux transporter periplasmic adaptor subunit [Casimicrobium huifangae]HQD65415.1 HlyD family efflux transporter periplasmic adaptor subunit [Casimicrobium huifangae]